MKRGWLFAMVLTGMGAVVVQADAPAMIHYQGRLAEGSSLYSGPVRLVFRLYDAPTAGTQLHYSTNFATAVDGLYATVIGQYGVVGDLDAALTNVQVWLEVEVNGNILSPRERLMAVPYARAVHGMRVVQAHSIVLNAKGGTNSIAAGANYSSIGGGAENQIQMFSDYATISGGYQNQIQTDSDYATIGGGWSNQVQPDARLSTIGGGYLNQIQTNSSYATIGGGRGNRIQADSWYATIGGGNGNRIQADSWYATIGGGNGNQIQADSRYATIGGGNGNQIQTNSDYATIGGGDGNQIQTNSIYATIGGGRENKIQPETDYVALGGGYQNQIQTDSDYATIGGGGVNQIQSNSSYATIGGGFFNVIGPTSYYAVIPGGFNNRVGNNATGACAMGWLAHALHAGAFVWSDKSSGAPTASTNANSVTFRAAGGFRIFTSAAMTSGVAVAPGSGSWTSLSDKNAKEGFEPVNPKEVLEKVVELPIATWRYKGQPEQVRHMGPTAQDFYEAFGLGDAPGYGITTVDADGVLFAAVQALARQNERIARENEDLRRRIEELEKRIQGPVGGSF
ncbi:MAG: tail fiber domain-containing protein [Kiritimatiellae bacterium]|nr:tail fiber domain-containing protein [Kiritimatiellia bacterium]MDW8457682.1 tail fiber domain-containing protein [Verrucomicrobiota bacterium]